MQRIESWRVVDGIGRRSVSRAGTGASQRARRIVVAIRIVIAVHGGQVGLCWCVGWPLLQGTKFAM